MPGRWDVRCCARWSSTTLSHGEVPLVACEHQGWKSKNICVQGFGYSLILLSIPLRLSAVVLFPGYLQILASHPQREPDMVSARKTSSLEGLKLSSVSVPGV